jgi:GNAT superfamily N-acetyltransferase
MTLQIREGTTQDIAAIVELSLLAWEPVFDSFRQVMGPTIFAILYPDWRQVQTATVEKFCQARANAVLWVAEWEGAIAGFLVCEFKHGAKEGEVQLLAVHPAYQNQGIGTALNNYALAKMKAEGMILATVATGGDPGHAPARRSYEKAGYRPIPQVWYCQDL